MYIIGHQNMKVYGNNSLRRVAAFAPGFAAFRGQATRSARSQNRNIGQTSSPQNFLVFGFTEIRTANPDLSAICTLLDMPHPVTIACGDASENHREYISITCNDKVDEYTFFRVLKVSGANEVRVDDDDTNFHDLPDWAALGVRGVVFAVVKIDGKYIGVGYIHNIYNDETVRTTTMLELPKYMKAAEDYVSDLGISVTWYLGGDFNAPPTNVGTDRGPGRLYSHSAENHRLPSGTTAGGNTYDYWFSRATSDLNGMPLPGVCNTTLTGSASSAANLGSDHCGIYLVID